MAVGIICEYNPFHYGHLYHLDETKRLFPNEEIILVMSTHFLERGDVSLLDKWTKTKIALEFGIDIVVELPFVFSSGSADIFAKGSIEILNNLNVNHIVFGSELGDIDVLYSVAKAKTCNKNFDELVTKSLDMGLSYPDAVGEAIFSISNVKISNPNDILGICYITEIIKQKAKIIPIAIKRTNDYNSKNLNSDIVSASAIRDALLKNIDIKKYVPKITYDYLQKGYNLTEEYFGLLKYKIISELNNLDKYQSVDEGIENRIKKYIFISNSLEELIQNIKTKRYTYNRIKRMLIYILTGFTKEEKERNKSIRYIRVLGFGNKGQRYLNTIKKDTLVPIITKFSSIKDEMLDIEYRASSIYYINDLKLLETEYKNKPVIKDE